MLESVERDGVQAECWSRTIKAMSELFGQSSLWVANYLLDLPKESFNEMLVIYGGEYWGKRLEELGGAK